MTEFYLPSHGKGRIHCVQWTPPGQPRAVVQLVHGIAEYVARYDSFARFLNRQGFLVVGEDHMGHGGSLAPGDPPGYFHGGWNAAVDDTYALLQKTHGECPQLPYVILGHSMGSFLTRTYLCRYPGEVDGAILSGTGQERAPLVALGKAVASILCRFQGSNSVNPLIHQLSLGAYNKKFKPNRTGADWISRDQAAVDTYLADPLCSFKPTTGMFRDMMGGLQYISSPRALARMDPETPIYLMSGDQDPVGSMGKGVKKVYGYFEQQGVKDLSLKLYPGGRHEMFNETNRQEVLEDLLVWLEKHV